MEAPVQRRYARVLLAVFTLLGLAWLARLDYAEKISTNIIDLIPTDERAPEITLVRTIIGERQAKAVMFALRTGNAAAPEAAVQRFAESLRQSGHFSDVAALADATHRERLGRFVFERRFELLLPSWLAQKHEAFAATGKPAADFSAWLAGEAARELDTFVGQPESVAFQELLPADPLLLLPKLAQNSDALGFARNSTEAALVWALIKASPFEKPGQDPVFEAIDRATTAAKEVAPALQVQWTGINRFASESRSRIHNELSVLNTVSILAVLAVACVFVRRLWKVLHLLPVILLSVLGAWVVTTAVFERLHILVFVVGSLLTGVAIDYGFYLYMQPALRPDEPYAEKLRRLLKPLLTSCLTTVIGFSFLLFSELPLIQQLGVFVSAGLISALVAAILYFAQLDRAFLETRNLPRPDTRQARWLIRGAGAAVAAVAVWGLFHLSWRDDVRELDFPAPELRENDQQVRRLFGDSATRTAYITRGANPLEARASLEEFLRWHTGKFPDRPAASLAWLIPSPDDWNKLPQRLAALDSFENDFRTALEQRGYTPDGFEAFFQQWRGFLAGAQSRPPLDTVIADVHARLSGPLALLAHTGPGDAWFISIADHASSEPPPPEFSTVLVSQLESLNTLFARYRASAVRLSVAGLALVGLSVFVLYGLRRGFRVFLIPSGSCLVAFGLLGAMGEPLNLFHLLGAFLGVCLSHNYAIFSAENAGRREAPPPSIRMSALTTAASFGVLAFSQIPVVAALGTIVAIIVLTALLAVELEPLAAP